MGMLAQRPR